MELIDKEKVEEILRNLWKEDDGHNSEHRICYNKALQEVLCEIDTLEAKEVDLDDLARYYLLNEHKSPLSIVLHKADIKTEMQYHEDIENAYKAGFKYGLKAKAIKIPMVEWQSPCDQCDNPQMDCMNCPKHPVNRYETAYQKVLYQGNPTKENNWINQLYKGKEE